MSINKRMDILCQNGCGKLAIRVTKKGKHICSTRPAGCPEIMKKMQQTSILKYGVPNPSSVEIFKKKRIQTFIERYGVSNPSHLDDVIEKISSEAIKRWDVIRAGKKYTNEGLTRIQYRNRCQTYANTMYNKYKHILDPNSLRGSIWHLDHIYSVEDGFMNDVPYNILSDVSNLRIIRDTENYQKFSRSEKTLEELFEDFKRFQSSITAQVPNGGVIE